jgi:hypothetical protein
VYITDTQTSQINDLEKQAKPKTIKRRKIIKIRAQINEIDTKIKEKESMQINLVL